MDSAKIKRFTIATSCYLAVFVISLAVLVNASGLSGGAVILALMALSYVPVNFVFYLPPIFLVVGLAIDDKYKGAFHVAIALLFLGVGCLSLNGLSDGNGYVTVASAIAATLVNLANGALSKRKPI